MLPIKPRWRCLVVAVLAAALAPVGCLRAQQQPAMRRVSTQPEQNLATTPGHLPLLGANMLLSGLTGGVLRWHRGGSFLEGFAVAAAGGAAIYGGKALAVGQGTASPFLGRELAALGASAVRNTGAGRGPLQRVTLPLGPVHFHLARGEALTPWLSVDLLGVAVLTGSLLAYDARIDWAATVASGAPVLRVSDPEDRLPWNGRHLAGTVLIRDDRGSRRPVASAITLAHERVHLLQYDQLALTWSDPAEQALLERWAWARAIQPHIDLGLNSVVHAALRLLSAAENPVEIEARFLAEHRQASFLPAQR